MGSKRPPRPGSSIGRRYFLALRRYAAPRRRRYEVAILDQDTDPAHVLELSVIAGVITFRGANPLGAMANAQGLHVIGSYARLPRGWSAHFPEPDPSARGMSFRDLDLVLGCSPADVRRRFAPQREFIETTLSM
jgi:hypothetical protein